jgi:hypothetical protein
MEKIISKTAFFRLQKQSQVLPKKPTKNLVLDFFTTYLSCVKFKARAETPRRLSLSPFARRRPTMSSLSLALLQEMARKVPRPLARLSSAGNSPCSCLRPDMRRSPERFTCSSKFSFLITSTTPSKSINLPGSPIHVLKILYDCGGLRSEKKGRELKCHCFLADIYIQQSFVFNSQP